MGYFSWQEDEAFREGKRDAEWGRRNYDYDEHAWDGKDRAYYDGRKEYDREEERRNELREEERRMEENEERRRMEHNEHIRYLEEREMEEECIRSHHQQENNQQEPDGLPF